jgi:hypothetical protein
MSEKIVIGVYDSLNKAERAELRLGDVHLPVSDVFLVTADVDAGKARGKITAPEVAEAVADAGVALAQEQLTEYQEALKAGKHLLVFHGDEEEVAKAYRTLEDTDADELQMLGE